MLRTKKASGGKGHFTEEPCKNPTALWVKTNKMSHVELFSLLSLIKTQGDMDRNGEGERVPLRDLKDK